MLRSHGEARNGAAVGAADEMPAAASVPGSGATTDPAAGPAAAVTTRVLRALGTVTRAHRGFVVLLLAGATLRVAAELGYRWAIWFNDSFDYVAVALRLRPDPVRPIGYPLLLRLLLPAHSLALVTSVQHVLGLGCAVLIYTLLRVRFRLPGWAAALAAAPVLLDAYQIQLEQLLLADTLFMFLTIAAITIACWTPGQRGTAARARIGTGQAALAGAALALAALTRPVGIPLIMIAVGYLAIRRSGWRATTAITAAACTPIAGYVLWFHAVYGQFALNSTDGIFLWGRAAAFAECDVIKPPRTQTWLCPALPPAQRAASSSQVWQPASPFHWRHGQVFSAAENDRALRFALRAVAAQPADYARTVLTSIGRSFGWNRTAYPTGYTASLYTFAGAKTWLPAWPEPDGRTAAQVARAYGGRRAAAVAVAPYSGVMRWYQRYVYVHGTLTGIVLLTPLAAAIGAAAGRLRRRAGAASRAVRRPPEAGPDARFGTGWAAAWLCWSAAVALLVIPAATVDFDYRYVLPAAPLGCLAAALATASACRGRPRTPAGQRRWRGMYPAAASIRVNREMTKSDG